MERNDAHSTTVHEIPDGSVVVDCSCGWSRDLPSAESAGMVASGHEEAAAARDAVIADAERVLRGDVTPHIIHLNRVK